ncbi:MAG TPA: PIN domain-containing protein [Elusimicrobiota bacterium]|nr:PIN domain-containing protein [Elusimicrobiota bacterium]
MTPILRAQPLPHSVICDTNILWHDDTGPAVSPAFDKLWNEVTKEFELKLYIPDTVWKELQFRHYAPAVRELRSIEEAHKKITAITAKHHRTKISEQKLRQHVEVKFNNWVKAHKPTTILSLPHTVINWGRLANDAIWRIPPFSANEKNNNFEKGFRDALILETVVDFVGKHSDQSKIAFLCRDKMLKDTAAGRLKADARFAVYENLEDFRTYLRLTKEKLDSEFIAKIRFRAKEKFFKNNDDSCLVEKERLLEKLRNDYKNYYEDAVDPKKQTSGLQGLAALSASTFRWSPTNGGTHWFFPPEFLKIESPKRYFWKSIIRYFQLHTNSYATILGADSQRVLFLTFEIIWSAKVKDDARFHKLKIENIKLQSNEFRTPTTEEIESYRLVSQSPEKPLV